MSQSRPFSKLKKEIEKLFVPEINMQINCLSYPIRTQYGSTSTVRFYIKLGDEIIWDFPKNFPLNNIHYHEWAPNIRISELIREYIDTPVNEILSKEFENDKIVTFSKGIIDLNFTDLLRCADKRLGKNKLSVIASENPVAMKVFEKRYSDVLA